MTLTATIKARTLRRIRAAEGYLELGMPEYASRELEGVDNAGPLMPHVNLLRGTALMAQERYGAAIDPLRDAVRTVPAPYDRLAWWSLSKCFQHEGLKELAALAEKFAEAPPKTPEQTTAKSIFVLIFTHKSREDASSKGSASRE